ncbi:ABC transporter ATP-binding protein [Enterovibrio sp. ZSDZ35]|uniref:ABC transporter ATP-binding protein n=1 Tax=Enterovibrio qingdaonensis TaxID=2899818 RepID=A0ABT5QKB4_9GAMM|nr:ABC transporter ATP-binding protein [Enterovibrio sp. ZSDZ35]MDD1781435.1 ABC transporter ATP-binding protein [Enterovibrio sp. ZSDZ35]
MAELNYINVSKRFGEIDAVKGINLEVKEGEFMVLLGPTGAGKTTLLRLAAGLETCDSGDISLAGKNMHAVPPAERDVAFVFQQYSLYPHMSVYDNLAFPLRSKIRNVSEAEIKKRIDDVAEVLRIGHKLQNKATQLSGGEMQRVAIGRALVRKPALYLMDEPLSSLDAKLRADLRVELKRIQQELGATILYVTHDQIEAMTLGDRIGVLKDGELVQVGTPKDIYTNPDSDYVATRLGLPQINLLPKHCLNEQYSEGGVAFVGVRTEHLEFKADAEGAYSAVVQNVEYLGDQCHLHLAFEQEKITLLASPDKRWQRNDRVSFNLVNPVLFDRTGQRIRGQTY